MTNCLIGWLDNVRAGSITAGSETTAAPSTNLQTDQGAEAWRTAGVVTSADGAWVEVDAGSAEAWRAVALCRTNLTTAATVRIMLGTTASASDVYDSGALSGVVAGIGQFVHDLGADFTAQYLRIEIDDADNPDGVVSVGLLFGGACWQPGINLSYASAIGRDSQVQEVVTKGGQEFPIHDWSRRAWDIALELLSDDEAMEDIYELDRVARYGGNVLFIPRPASDHLQREAVFGRLKSTADISFPHQGSTLRAWRGRITERL